MNAVNLSANRSYKPHTVNAVNAVNISATKLYNPHAVNTVNINANRSYNPPCCECCEFGTG